MIFRCSVCKGQFELEPDRKKPVVFCAHCGAALKTGKPGSVKTPAMSAAEKALVGDAPDAGSSAGPESSPLDQLTSARSQPQGYVEMFEPAADAGAAAGGDPLAALTGESPAATGRKGFMRRPRLKKKDNTAAIMIISVVGLVGLLVVGGIILAVVLSQPEPVKPKREAPIGDGPGLFNNVKGEQTKYGNESDPSRTGTSDPPKKELHESDD